MLGVSLVFRPRHGVWAIGKPALSLGVGLERTRSRRVPRLRLDD
jgi:hypothetical protein